MLETTHPERRRSSCVRRPSLCPCGPAAPLVTEADRPVALLVEDDPATRALIAEMLRGEGWSVRQARDGEQGLALAREHVPEVILLDLALPRTSGLEVLRELKSPRWADQPTAVVVVSFFAC
jgi:CheY-like chemotaxis protein